jgi:hypothetical protein
MVALNSAELPCLERPPPGIGTLAQFTSVPSGADRIMCTPSEA